MSNPFDAKDVILTRERKGTVYEISPMTNSNMVYTDPETTLTETIDSINKDVDSRQPKEEGKGLSTNDFTNELRTKLETCYSRDDIDGIVDIINSNISRVKEI